MLAIMFFKQTIRESFKFTLPQLLVQSQVVPNHSAPTTKTGSSRGFSDHAPEAVLGLDPI